MLRSLFPVSRVASVIYNGQLTRSMSVIASKLVYSEFGEPVDVVRVVQEKLPEIQSDDVLVKVLAAPINPADINTIQGRYPVKPQFPAVGGKRFQPFILTIPFRRPFPGNECVAEVLQVGTSVSSLSVGDRVVPFQTGIGTWTSHAIYKATSLKRIPKDLGILEASTITVNPPTAYRMLKDFISLAPGDTVIQNGANSAVGQAVFQLCREWKLNCVGVVRDRPNLEELTGYLKSLGAAEVLTEAQVRTTQIFKSGQLKKPRLGLNCVGGKNCTEMIRHLDDKAALVTYGGMSREPVVAPTAALIFKDISFHGFWMTRWTRENHSSTARDAMFEELMQLMLAQKFKGPTAIQVPFADYKMALANALSFQGFIGQKYVLNFD